MFEQRIHDEAAVVRHVGHHHPKQVIHLPRERGALHHLGPGLHTGAKQVHGIALVAFGVFFEPHIEVGRQPQPHGLGPDQCHIAGDHAAVFQALDAAQHGAGRQAHLLANHIVGFASVVLQAAQDGLVQLVEGIGVVHCAGFYEQGRRQAPPILGHRVCPDSDNAHAAEQ